MIIVVVVVAVILIPVPQIFVIFVLVAFVIMAVSMVTVVMVAVSMVTCEHLVHRAQQRELWPAAVTPEVVHLHRPDERAAQTFLQDGHRLGMKRNKLEYSSNEEIVHGILYLFFVAEFHYSKGF